MSELLTIFLKCPRPGLVKTRLAREAGEGEALAIYRKLVEITLKSVPPGPAVELRFAPDEGFEEIKPWLKPGWSARGQGGGDLGERLGRAFEEGFGAGHLRHVIIGSDCPEICAADIEAAFRLLQSSAAVVGPATDGGYWLIGLSRPAPALFEKIPWSTSSVFERTVEAARRAGFEPALLRPLSDVDTRADWQRFAHPGDVQALARQNARG